MSDYKHILLTIDLSNYSQYISLKTQKQANLHQENLSLFHVINIAW